MTQGIICCAQKTSQLLKKPQKHRKTTKNALKLTKQRKISKMSKNQKKIAENIFRSRRAARLCRPSRRRSRCRGRGRGCRRGSGGRGCGRVRMYVCTYIITYVCTYLNFLQICLPRRYYDSTNVQSSPWCYDAIPCSHE